MRQGGLSKVLAVKTEVGQAYSSFSSIRKVLHDGLNRPECLGLPQEEDKLVCRTWRSITIPGSSAHFPFQGYLWEGRTCLKTLELVETDIYWESFEGLKLFTGVHSSEPRSGCPGRGTGRGRSTGGLCLPLLGAFPSSSQTRLAPPPWLWLCGGV